MSEQEKESEFVKFWKEKSGWFKQGEDLELSLSNSEGHLAQVAWNAAFLQAQDKLKDLERPPIGIVVKPCLFEVVRKLAGTSSRVFTHLQQKEEILFFYDRALLRQHLDSRLDHCICRHHLSDHVWGSNKERDGCKLCDCTAYIEPDWLEEAQAV